MSATTRRTSPNFTQRLESLYYSADALIEGRQRSKKSINRLLDALQFFKEDRLGEVWSEDSQKAKTRKRVNRFALRRRLQSEYGERAKREGKDLATLGIHIFGFSRTILASMFTRSLPELRELLTWPENHFLDTPEAKMVVSEIREKVEPYGLSFGMTFAEIWEAFGPPPGLPKK